MGNLIHDVLVSELHRILSEIEPKFKIYSGGFLCLSYCGATGWSPIDRLSLVNDDTGPGDGDVDMWVYCVESVEYVQVCLEQWNVDADTNSYGELQNTSKWCKLMNFKIPTSDPLLFEKVENLVREALAEKVRRQCESQST